MDFETKDSGERETYTSGMQRDVQSGKPNFDLLVADGVAYEDQFLTRFASLLTRGSVKYGSRNWELANSQEELDRFRASALRHMLQWACGEVDEDHAAAVAFNLMAYETIKAKMKEVPDGGVRLKDSGIGYCPISGCNGLLRLDSSGFTTCSRCGRFITSDF